MKGPPTLVAFPMAFTLPVCVITFHSLHSLSLLTSPDPNFQSKGMHRDMKLFSCLALHIVQMCPAVYFHLLNLPENGKKHYRLCIATQRGLGNKNPSK